MRTVMRFILLSLVVAPVAYWLLGGLSMPTFSASPAVNNSLCERVDWHFAPGGITGRHWVATMEGAQDDPQVAEWLRMSDTDRGAFLARCGKERG